MVRKNDYKVGSYEFKDASECFGNVIKRETSASMIENKSRDFELLVISLILFGRENT